jgi:hypothetical protein
VSVPAASEAHARRSLVSWGLALALHGAALVALLAGSRVPPVVDEGPVVEVTLEKTLEAEETPEPRAEPAAPGEVAPATAAIARNAATATAAARVEEPVLTAEPVPGASATASDGWAPVFTMNQGINLGLDGGIVYRPTLAGAGGSAGGGDMAPGPRPDVGGLRAALHEHDQELGLGSGGRIGSAVRDAHRIIADLREGAATMQVVTDAAGNVVSVRVTDVTSDERGWAEAAEAIRSALRQRPLNVPNGARGVVVTVRVEVAMRLPSGSRGGVSGLLNGDGIGGSADLSDIGARPQAIAKTRVLSEEAL